MRYLIFYPPTKSIKLIDMNENVRVEDVLKLAQREFGLKSHVISRSKKSFVLSYNGSDLKPKWSLADLNIPSGAILRCVFREQKEADLYVHCGFNRQIVKLFDPTITTESTIGDIRKKISEKLGLPLSTFCLEKYDGKERLLDRMKLMSYDIKFHDYVYLKVWKGYEKLISSWIRGYNERYSHDDLTRNYQIQIALHIAAFYGHMELATSVMQHGARSDRSVGEHPSRQWSSETIATILPEALKCPIHIAIERGHVKMVDLFVRHSILCTQVRDPVTDYLPYRLAILCSMRAKTKEQKQCFSHIYFYLHDKQFNLKIPLNANGDYVSSLLTSKSTIHAIHRKSTPYVYISLPGYCRIISWYERAREKVWKKFGGASYTNTQIKRVFPEKGLLGYKVLIDGYNNKFEVPAEQPVHGIRSDGTIPSAQPERYAGYNNEEREKILQTKTFMKQFASDERRRVKQIPATNPQPARRPPLVLSRTANNEAKLPAMTAAQLLEDISSSSEFSSSLIASSLTASDLKAFQNMLDTDDLSVLQQSLVSELIRPVRVENNQSTKEKSKGKSKTLRTVPAITINNESNQHAVPITISPVFNALTTHPTPMNKSETANNTNKQAYQPVMSSTDAYFISSARLASADKRHNALKKDELFTEIEEALQQQDQDLSKVPISNPLKPLNQSQPVEREYIPDVDSYLPLPDYPTSSRTGLIKSRLDLAIRQSTFEPYERYASASIRSTAVSCLEEAGYFKKKSWLKQVEISQEMLKHRVQQRVSRATPETTNQPTSRSLLAASITTLKAN